MIGGFIVWLFILVLCIANGWNTAMWILLVGTAVLLIFAAISSTQPEKEDGAVKRIDRPQYLDEDVYECPRCGARFRENVMACPKCGCGFEGNVVDEEEYDEEEEFWEDMEDEEEGW